MPLSRSFRFFFFNDTATTEIYTLSLHDALPICSRSSRSRPKGRRPRAAGSVRSPSSRLASAWQSPPACADSVRSEEHTSELQSQSNLVCRLLLEKKKQTTDATERPRSTTDLSVN